MNSPLDCVDLYLLCHNYITWLGLNPCNNQLRLVQLASEIQHLIIVPKIYTKIFNICAKVTKQGWTNEASKTSCFSCLETDCTKNVIDNALQCINIMEEE